MCKKGYLKLYNEDLTLAAGQPPMSQWYVLVLAGLFPFTKRLRCDNTYHLTRVQGLGLKAVAHKGSGVKAAIAAGLHSPAVSQLC